MMATSLIYGVEITMVVTLPVVMEIERYNMALKNAHFVRWDALGHARPLAYRYNLKE